MQGKVPNFDEISMSEKIIIESEVQSIIVTASTTDLGGGFFIVNVMGHASRKIFIDLNAHDVKNSLESLLTIDKDDLSMNF